MLGWLRRKFFGGDAEAAGGDPFAEARERARRLVYDLHTLEINTIKNAAMTAQRMPPMPASLAEIAADYGDWLKDKCNGESLPADKRRRRADEFKFLHDEARSLLDSGACRDDSDRVIVQRIHRNCAYLTALAESAEKIPEAKPYVAEHTLHDLLTLSDEILEKVWHPTQADRAKVRKIWEVGTELVLMQSVIQLEGDVVTRFSPLLFAKENERVIDIHQQAIKTSTRMWSVLIGAIGALAGLKIEPPGPDR